MNNSFQQIINNMLKTIIQIESAEIIVSFHIILNEKNISFRYILMKWKTVSTTHINLSSVKANLYKYLQFDWQIWYKAHNLKAFARYSTRPGGIVMKRTYQPNSANAPLPMVSCTYGNQERSCRARRRRLKGARPYRLGFVSMKTISLPWVRKGLLLQKRAYGSLICIQ